MDFADRIRKHEAIQLEKKRQAEVEAEKSKSRSEIQHEAAQKILDDIIIPVLTEAVSQISSTGKSAEVECDLVKVEGSDKMFRKSAYLHIGPKLQSYIAFYGDPDQARFRYHITTRGFNDNAVFHHAQINAAEIRACCAELVDKVFPIS